MNRNIEQALFLGDGSVSRFFDHLKEQKYYDQIIASSVSAHFRMDSIALDYAHYPYRATVYGHQEIIKSTTLSIRELVCSCTLRNVPRSDNNSHGLLIENFLVLSNKEIQVLDRTN
jgi:conjugative transposon TraK protein